METKTAFAVPTWDLADRMRKAMRHAGLSSQEIADYLGVSRTSVSAWINGRVRPSAPTLRVWALRCGVSFEWLRDGQPGGSIVRYSGLSGLFRPVRWAA